MSLSTLAFFLSSTVAEPAVLDGARQMACLFKCKALYGGCRVRHPEDATICQKSEMVCMEGCSSSSSDSDELEATTNSLTPLGKYVGSLELNHESVPFEMDFHGVFAKKQVNVIVGGDRLHVSCLNEPYGYYAKGPGKMLWLTLDGCLDKALEANDMELVYENYDGSTDVVSVQIRVAKDQLVTVHLEKGGLPYTEPAGKYAGSLELNNKRVVFDMDFHGVFAKKQVNVVSKQLNISCLNEPYGYYAKGPGKLLWITENSCLENALEANNMELLWENYDGATDVVSVQVVIKDDKGSSHATVVLKPSQGGSLVAPARFE